MENYKKNIENLINSNKWVKSTEKGSAAVGLTLESLLGKEKENFEIPDYHGIEIKCKYSTCESYINLFNAAPDSYLFEIKRLVNTYGYPSKDLPEYKALNISILGNRKTKLPSGYYFKLSVNWKTEQVILNVYNKNQALIDCDCAWSFSMLKEKIERKLSMLAFIKAERKWNETEKAVYFKYNEVNFYELKPFERFISLLEMGKIRIMFKIGVYKTGPKKGNIYDHGTSFAIKDCNLENLFTRL